MDTLLNRCKALHLLYVEDNDEARKYTLEMLKRFFDVISIARNGEEGLQKFKEDGHDLVITDINMPKMSGLVMISHIRAIDPNIPILVLSAHNEPDYYEDASAIGISAYLPKPLTLQQTLDAFGLLFGEESQ